MSNKRRTDMCLSTSLDRISNLPDVIIEEILVKLPLKDTIRTSILSSQWKHKWKRIPKIVLDKNNVKTTREKTLSENFSYTVDEVLRNHRGDIHEFKLSLSYLRTLHSSWYISKWIRDLAKKNIQDLNIDIQWNTADLEDGSLFTCENLRLLKLRNCIVKTHDSHNPLKLLKEFWLGDINISKQDLEMLLGKCPVLEKLALVNVSVDPVEVDVPSLQILFIQGRFTNLHLKNAERVTNLLIHHSSRIPKADRIGYRGDCKLSTILVNVPNVELLHVWSHSMELLSLGNERLKLRFMLNNLKDIFLTINFGNKDEVSAALCLLKSAPNLLYLRIGVYLTNVASTRKAEDLWKNHLEFDHLFEHLKVVTLMQCCGIESELEFIVYILVKSPRLQKMTIQVRENLYDKAIEWLQALSTGRKSLIEMVKATEAIDFRIGLAKRGRAW